MRTSNTIVYPLGTGSVMNDEELRYSLRSVEMYLPHSIIYLVGHKPDWVRNVGHLKAQDLPGIENKEFNIMSKIKLACQRVEAKEIIVMNDDHFLLKPWKTVPYYYQDDLKTTLERRSGHDHYYYSLENTLNALNGRTLNFDIHCPILYDTQEFIRIMDSHPWNAYGYVIKSLYSNSMKVRPVKTTDLKINQRLNCFELEKLTDGRKFFSVSDKAMHSEMITFLKYIYPNKSQYEA